MEALEETTTEQSIFEQFIDGDFTRLESSIYQMYADNIGYDLDEIADWASECEDAYVGQWDNDEEFAEELFREGYAIPAHLDAYIDWESVARDVMYDHFEIEGHYFRNI